MDQNIHSLGLDASIPHQAGGKPSIHASAARASEDTGFNLHRNPFVKMGGVRPDFAGYGFFVAEETIYVLAFWPVLLFNTVLSFSGLSYIRFSVF